MNQGIKFVLESPSWMVRRVGTSTIIHVASSFQKGTVDRRNPANHLLYMKPYGKNGRFSHINW